MNYSLREKKNFGEVGREVNKDQKIKSIPDSINTQPQASSPQSTHATSYLDGTAHGWPTERQKNNYRRELKSPFSVKVLETTPCEDVIRRLLNTNAIIDY